MGAVSEDMKNGDPEQVHRYKRAKAPNNSLSKWCLNGTKFMSRELFDLDVQHYFGFESSWKSDIIQVFFVKKNSSV